MVPWNMYRKEDKRYPNQKLIYHSPRPASSQPSPRTSEIELVNTGIGKLSETYRFKDLPEKTFWSWFLSGGGEGEG
ncbi:hypothetical protein M422DRAFT_32770, partial [Sphaerobolus stellatus SS14]